MVSDNIESQFPSSCLRRISLHRTERPATNFSTMTHSPTGNKQTKEKKKEAIAFFFLVEPVAESMVLVLPYSVFVVDFDEQELAEVGPVRHADFLPPFCPFFF